MEPTTSGGSGPASGEHQIARRGCRERRNRFKSAFALALSSRNKRQNSGSALSIRFRPSVQLSSRKHRRFSSNVRAKRSTVLIAVEFWRILVDLREAIGRGVLRSASVASSLQTCYVDVMDGFATWILAGRGESVAAFAVPSAAAPTMRPMPLVWRPGSWESSTGFQEARRRSYGCLGQPVGGIQGPPFGPTSSGLPGGNTLSALALT
jgi:hypothetical protein